MKRFLVAALLVASTQFSFGQNGLKLPALSPTTKITQEFATSSIEINYSRPSMRNRKIFGDLVRYGNVWRTGANSSTKIKFGEDVELNGNKVKAGEYALYSIPNKDKWEIILNTGVGTWGPTGYSRENDVLRFTVAPSKMEGVCQTFTINIADISYSTCKLELMWERTKIQIPIEVHNDDALAKNIDKAINNPAIPYFQVANYYFESGKHLNQASMYVDKALETEPKAYYMWYLKARIEKKLGHKESAIEAAKKSIETSKDSAFEEDYKHNNQKIIDELTSGKLPTDKSSY